MTIFLLFGLSAGATARVDGGIPSFDCNKAHEKAEFLICAVVELEELDAALDAIYRDALTVSRERASTVKQEQLDWLKKRNHACALDDTDATAASAGDDQKRISCMADIYRDRISALIAQNISPVLQSAIHDPQRALSQLRPLQSPLAVAYTDLLTHILADESATDFVTSFEALAERYSGQDANLRYFDPITIPCGLIERYPRLLLAGRPYFWSSLDVDLPHTSCDDDYQAYPAAVGGFLTHNEKTLQQWAARCTPDGTAEDGFARYIWLHELRMARFPRSYLTETVTWLDSPDKPWPSQDTLAHSDWNSDPDFLHAHNALTDYYHRKFGLGQAEAAMAATRALWDNRDMSEDPGQCN